MVKATVNIFYIYVMMVTYIATNHINGLVNKNIYRNFLKQSCYIWTWSYSGKMQDCSLVNMIPFYP